jgi:hypothetical protein
MGGHTFRMLVAGEELAKGGAARAAHPVVAASKRRAKGRGSLGRYLSPSALGLR